MEDFEKKFILALLAYASQKGVRPQRLCELAGIDYKLILQRQKKPVSAEQINSLWKNAAYLTKDDLFGLHFGESMQLAALGVIGQIVQTSATVGEALSNAGSIIPLITDMFRMRLHHGKTSFKVIFTADVTKAVAFTSTYRHMSDFLMVFTIHELNGLVLEKTEPIQAKFSYIISDGSKMPLDDMKGPGNDTRAFQYTNKNSNDRNEYERVLGCKLSRKVDETFIEFPEKILRQEILSANYELQNHLLNQVSILMKANDADGPFHKKVYNYLLSNSFLYSLTLEAVAANFNMSVRSLQRKLKNEGITFLEIVDAVRMALAITYLKSGSHALKDIGFVLGYNEPTAFVRAFKRWTGKTPVAYKTTIQTEKRSHENCKTN